MVRFVYTLLFRFVSPPHKPARQKILVASFGKIGDLVATTPLFRMLAEHLGEPVDLIANDFAAELLKGNSALRKIHPRGADAKVLARENYSHVLILLPSHELIAKSVRARIPNIFSTTHKNLTKRERLYSIFISQRFPYDFEASAEEHYLKFASALGALNSSHKREIFFDKADTAVAEKFTHEHDLSEKKLIGISVTAGKRFKEWGLDNFARAANKLISRDFVVIGVGARQDQEKLEELKTKLDQPKMFVNTAGRFSLSEFAALAKHFQLFIASDTGPLYVADALEVPVVDIMGPCSSQSQRPTGPQAIIVGECKNPEHVKSYIMNSPNYRGKDFQRCMLEVSFDEVWAAVQSVLK